MVKISGSTKIYGKTVFDTTPYIEYNLWNFSSSSGTILSNLKITHDINVKVSWGDESGDQNVDSGVNYNHISN